MGTAARANRIVTDGLGLACRAGISLFAWSSVGFVSDRHSLMLSIGPSYVTGEYKRERVSLHDRCAKTELSPQVIAGRLPLMLLVFSHFASCLGSVRLSGY